MAGKLPQAVKNDIRDWCKWSKPIRDDVTKIAERAYRLGVEHGKALQRISDIEAENAAIDESIAAIGKQGD